MSRRALRIMGGTLISGLLAVHPLAAQQQAPPTCDKPEFRQFDFWVGDWDVTTPDDKPAGKSRITSILKGCVIHEEWTGAGGGNGESFNIWSRADGHWHQEWVSDSGALLSLTGDYKDGRMVLTGERKLPNGSTVQNRITWSLIDNSRDRVRQFWETSQDGGKTWSSAFDGVYKRRR